MQTNGKPECHVLVWLRKFQEGNLGLLVTQKNLNRKPKQNTTTGAHNADDFRGCYRETTISVNYVIKHIDCMF